MKSSNEYSEEENKIIQKLTKYETVKYSDFRKEFDLNDNLFLDRFCHLLTTGKIVIYGYSQETTEFPDEVKIIRDVAGQTDKKLFLKVLAEEPNSLRDLYIALKTKLRKIYHYDKNLIDI